MAIDHRAIVAAGNNADLYAAMFSSHGLRYDRLPYGFVGRDRPPPFYSNLTVLSPGHAGEIDLQIRTLAQSFDGALGVKDSFCELDLGPSGFDVLFNASWIWRDAGLPTCTSTWTRIATETDLRFWETAWKQAGSATQHRMFTGTLLEQPEIAFLGQKRGDGFEAGCIANISDGCVGISNVFSLSLPDDVFRQATAAVASIAPHLPIAGYEAGPALNHARQAGFEAVGDLRVLVSRAARF